MYVYIYIYMCLDAVVQGDQPRRRAGALGEQAWRLSLNVFTN